MSFARHEGQILHLSRHQGHGIPRHEGNVPFTPRQGQSIPRYQGYLTPRLTGQSTSRLTGHFTPRIQSRSIETHPIPRVRRIHSKDSITTIWRNTFQSKSGKHHASTSTINAINWHSQNITHTVETSRGYDRFKILYSKNAFTKYRFQ